MNGIDDDLELRPVGGRPPEVRIARNDLPRLGTGGDVDPRGHALFTTEGGCPGGEPVSIVVRRSCGCPCRRLLEQHGAHEQVDVHVPVGRDLLARSACQVRKRSIRPRIV
jgi:hypothetical protein